VDVIIEGKITREEGVDEVLKTCAEIKSVKTPILRINDGASELQGQIAFSQGGYIIGGKINQTGEIGYPAVRRLLMVSEGNYAILDPLRKHITDVNQSLWLKIDKLVPLLPNLPENPDGLLDKQPDIEHSVKSGQFDIASGLVGLAETNKIQDTVAAKPAVLAAQVSKSRKLNLGAWRVFRTGMVIIVGFTAILASFTYYREIYAFFLQLTHH
jgi:hypothetical protein